MPRLSLSAVSARYSPLVRSGRVVKVLKPLTPLHLELFFIELPPRPGVSGSGPRGVSEAPLSRWPLLARRRACEGGALRSLYTVGYSAEV